MATTRLSVVTPAALKFEGEVELVIAPGAAGDLGVLANHAPLLTTLRTGLVKAVVVGRSVGDAKPETERVEFCVDGGFMQVLPDRVIILTDTALARDEVDVAVAGAELKRAEEALAQKKGADDLPERRAVAWAQAKLDVAHSAHE